ncbi:oligosaccharide flippase family protein [Nostoc sp. CHAB 5844]|nr:oligosaccharide flippase family protein [Nostoc sp. CHAB 5844]
MSEKHKLISNSVSMLINRLTQGVISFVLTTAIARTLGAYQLGQYLLAISYYYIFVNIASQGLKTFFTREISQEPEATPTYLVSGTCLQLIFSIIAYIALVLLVFLLPYSDDTAKICYVMGLTIIPFALSNITEAIFQAQEQMHLITISTVPIYILRLTVMIWLMQLKYGVEYLAGIIVVSETVILIIEWLLVTRTVQANWEIKPNFIWQSIKASMTFFAIEGVGIIASQLDVLILSLLGNEVLVGLYGSVGQLLQPFTIAANSVSLAAFPRMSKAVDSGKQAQRQISENIIEILLIMALPFCVGLLFVGQELLLFVYRNQEFAQATLFLQLTALTLIPYPFIRVLGDTLLANGLEKFNLIEVIITTITGGLSGIFLISQYKLVGAALMTIVMSMSALSLFIYVVSTRLFSLNLWRIFQRPLLISSLIGFVLFLLKQGNVNFIWTLVISTATYLLITSFLTIQTLGGIQSAWQKIVKR